MRIKRSAGERVFDSFNYLFLGFLAFSMLYPLWYLFALSFANPGEVALSRVYIWPGAVTLQAYQQVFKSVYILYGFLWSILRTVLGTAIAVFLGFNFAYVLSKKNLPNRGFWTGLLVLTMFFNGGLVPEYLNIQNLGLIDTVWALALPGCISAYNIVIMRNFIQSLPDSLEESARIDGANDIRILYKIIMPLSLPIIATISLWTAVGHWNAWFDGMIYIRTPEKQILQVTLRRVVLEGSSQLVSLAGETEDQKNLLANETIKAAMVIVTTLPILMVYPFIQKYFVKGIMIGSLKG
jgi:putative aldouronate transport system permease protein